MKNINRAPWLRGKEPYEYQKIVDDQSDKRRIIKKPLAKITPMRVTQMYGVDEIRISATKSEELSKLFMHYGGTFDYDKGAWIWSRSTIDLQAEWAAVNNTDLAVYEYMGERKFRGKKMANRKGRQKHKYRQITGKDGSSYVKKMSYYTYTKRELLMILKLMSQDLEVMGVEIHKLVSKKDIGSGNRNEKGLL